MQCFIASAGKIDHGEYPPNDYRATPGATGAGRFCSHGRDAILLVALRRVMLTQ
jgi:hypothetical protein